MDKVYGFYNSQASPQISPKDYFSNYSTLLKSSVCYEREQSTDEKMFQLMGVGLSKARLDLMSHYCSVNNLRTAESVNDEGSRDKAHDKCLENISDNTQLETLKALKKCNITLLQKYNTQSGIPIIYDKLESSIENVTPGLDFLVYVQVYKPFNSFTHRSKYYKPTIEMLRIKSVISILGCQYLTELRKKITCISDLSIMTNVSMNPDKQTRKLAKDVYKSGFFFIEDTFYNDMRDANNDDYSDVIIKWAAINNRLGPFKTARMEDTRVDSLCARFGYPWVYIHQGCCEHLIVLSDARLVTEDDDLLISTYPKIEKIKPTTGKNCSMCGILNVHWILTEHDRIPHDTSYFCENCFKSYNYIDGKKVGNFKAYRYPHLLELERRNIKNE
ncbi:PREDICTED: snRNA-activating protein complex subunit 3 [Dinoponera quadriceps]|uniref:snRNA-activating protein complex subunit 3 n=1 Tax=Dinoponera quadriceps TaxID=609295 RepID=A0A6P3XWP3_DINQU|nr:PREDICTED: snRNA-activating protein complex subunit 3 [Dinoponera quadriceps]XP_014482977.1 PREDICTED: snRNA-activating protein complex subunit 3 [Dinoponera quadriceps]